MFFVNVLNKCRFAVIRLREKMVKPDEQRIFSEKINQNLSQRKLNGAGGEIIWRKC